MFSHSSAKAHTNHPRNVPDDVLAGWKKNSGVVMVTFIPTFVSQSVADWENAALALRKGTPGVAKMERILAQYAKSHPRPVATRSQVADHIGHVRLVSGIDQVGNGCAVNGSVFQMRRLWRRLQSDEDQDAISVSVGPTYCAARSISGAAARLARRAARSHTLIVRINSLFWCSD